MLDGQFQVGPEIILQRLPPAFGPQEQDRREEVQIDAAIEDDIRFEPGIGEKQTVELRKRYKGMRAHVPLHYSVMRPVYERHFGRSTKHRAKYGRIGGTPRNMLTKRLRYITSKLRIRYRRKQGDRNA